MGNFARSIIGVKVDGLESRARPHDIIEMQGGKYSFCRFVGLPRKTRRKTERFTRRFQNWYKWCPSNRPSSAFALKISKKNPKTNANLVIWRSAFLKVRPNIRHTRPSSRGRVFRIPGRFHEGGEHGQIPHPRQNIGKEANITDLNDIVMIKTYLFASDQFRKLDGSPMAFNVFT